MYVDWCSVVGQSREARPNTAAAVWVAKRTVTRDDVLFGRPRFERDAIKGPRPVFAAALNAIRSSVTISDDLPGTSCDETNIVTGFARRTWRQTCA